jgi:hypothetical protein
MAVQKNTFTDTQGTITITNGDFQAFKKIAKDYNITNEEDVITFAIGVLSKANGRPVAIEQADGTLAKFLPAEKLKTANQPNQ